MRLKISSISLIMLAACGGGEGSGIQVEPLTPIEILRIEAQRLTDAVDGLSATAPSVVPDSGGATYSGIGTFAYLPESSLGDGVGGNMTIDVSFADDEVTGQIVNFYSRDGDAREGLITLSNGQIVRTTDGVAVVADVSGTLEILSDVRDLNGDLAGAFLGESGDYVSGLIHTQSSFTLPGDGGVVPMTINGAFILEQQ